MIQLFLFLTMKINMGLISLKSPRAFDVILIYYHTSVLTVLLGWSDTVFQLLYPKQAVTQVGVSQLSLRAAKQGNLFLML